MCGIYFSNILSDPEALNTRLNKIRYRGPDNRSLLRLNEIILAHLRLSIIDLDERSNQPFVFKHLSMTYNGEIYNYADIRKELINLGYTFETESDTEVLIKGYDAWGREVLQKMNGMFSFVIYDSIKNRAFCGRDRLGVKPFYYYWKDGDFEVCSQIQPLVNENCTLDYSALAIYMMCGYIPSPYSAYENIYKLPPGCVMEVDFKTRTKTISKYWDLGKAELLDITYDDAKQQLKELLADAIKIRLQADVPLGTFLSGGIDSTLVVAMASQLLDNIVKTFTIGFDAPDYDESKTAEQFASLLGTEHKSTMCTVEDVRELIPQMIEVYGEPFADSSSLPSLLLSRTTKKHVTVALSGDGGDESFIGYNHFRSIDRFLQVKKIPYFIRKIASIFFARDSKYRYILNLKDIDKFIERMFTGSNEFFKKGNTDWLDEYYPGFKEWSDNSIQKAADLNIKLWLENDSNVKVDRASMAYSLEIRSPFLDYRIVEFARKLPMEYRYDGHTTKKILKDILSEYLPAELIDLPKKGFAIPLKYWLHGSLKQDFFDAIDYDFLSKIPDIDMDKIRRIIHKYFEEKDSYYTAYIWRLYVLCKWKKMVVGK